MPVVIDRRDAATQPQGVEPGYAQTAQRWPSRPLARRPHGASELAAARPKLALTVDNLASNGAIGQRITVRAHVVDEDGAPVPGALVEVWHCNSAGKYRHPADASDAPLDPNFNGAARLVAGDSGLVQLRTIKPGAYPVPDSGGWWRPPHIHFSVCGRVWLSRLVTQMFFPGEPLNDTDAILNAVRDPQARGRCIARLVAEKDALAYEYQLVVRGRQASAPLP